MKLIRFSSLLKQSNARGADWASEHDASARLFSYGLCLLVFALALGQVALRWHGLRSAVSLGLGLAVATLAYVGIVRSRRSSPTGSAVIIQFCSLGGLLAVVPTVVFARVTTPGTVLGISQAFADGYIAGIFGGLLTFLFDSQQKP